MGRVGEWVCECSANGPSKPWAVLGGLKQGSCCERKKTSKLVSAQPDARLGRNMLSLQPAGGCCDGCAGGEECSDGCMWHMSALLLEHGGFVATTASPPFLMSSANPRRHVGVAYRDGLILLPCCPFVYMYTFRTLCAD